MHGSENVKLIKTLIINIFLFQQRMHYIFVIKIYIKIYSKTAPTYFGLTTIFRERLTDLR